MKKIPHLPTANWKIPQTLWYLRCISIYKIPHICLKFAKIPPHMWDFSNTTSGHATCGVTSNSKYFMIQNSILNTMMRFIWQENNDEMPEIVILWHNFVQKYSHVYALATFLKNFFASKFFLWVSYTLLKLFSTSWRKKSTSKFFWSRGFTIYPSGLNRNCKDLFRHIF